VRVWDLRAGGRDAMQVLAEFKDSVTSVACAPSQIVAGSVDGCLRTYDIRAGVVHCDDLLSPVTHVSLTSDARCVLSACLGGNAKLTDLASGKLMLEYSGHTHSAFKVECGLLADDRSVVCGSEDGAVHVWDFTTARPRPTLRAHSKCTSSVAPHPDKEQLISASLDGTMKLWDFGLNPLAQTLINHSC
jgi:mitogen-activated protein kinase organizer 1